MNFEKNLREITEKVKKMNDKEKIRYITIIGLVGIAMVFAANFFSSSSTQRTSEEVQVKEEDGPASAGVSANSDYQAALQSDLKRILGQIEGVGEIDIMITFESNERKEIAYNIQNSTSVTSESDNQGGERTIEQGNTNENAIMVNASGSNEPLVVTENYPEIRGVIVVADGVSNKNVEYNLLKGIENALDLPAHKITIYQKK